LRLFVHLRIALAAHQRATVTTGVRAELNIGSTAFTFRHKVTSQAAASSLFHRLIYHFEI
jgi:hypothetical protein